MPTCRAAEHDLLNPYGPDARLSTKLHACTLTGAEYQTHGFYINIGPTFADPLAQQQYAEIASVEAQHITHYGSMLNPEEPPMRIDGTQFVGQHEEGRTSIAKRASLNADGSPSQAVSETYSWMPGTELMRPEAALTEAA